MQMSLNILFSFEFLFQIKPVYQENERSLLLFACGWQEPDSIPSNVVIKNRKEKKRKDDGACAACYCGAYYPIDGAYYCDAPMYDGGVDGCDLGSRI